MSVYLLRLWNSDKKFYEWVDEKILKKTHADPNVVTDGFLKRFMFFKTIIVCKNNNVWNLRFNGYYKSITEIDDINVIIYGLFVKTTVVYSGVRYAFYEISIVEAFSKIFDPTYDYLDRLNIFGCWLVDKFRNQN